MEASKNNTSKLKLAIYWGAACGGCCVSVLDVHEHLYDIVEAADLVFWPIALDTKYKDVEEMEDHFIDITLFNGAIRNSENEHMAHLLRQKSKILVAYGSCAYEGCIPALSNLTTAEATFNAVYHANPSIENSEGVRPQLVSQVPEGELTLPAFYNTVKSLDQVVPVDYYIPGCPPEPPQIWAVLEAVVAALTEGAELPPPGSVVGAGTVAVCEECPLEKNVKTIKRFYRPYDNAQDFFL